MDSASPPTLHVLGAGVAGLACATAAVERGAHVVLYDAAGQAGGRCRSFHDPVLDRIIDNGNHLILGGNPETFRYLDRIGAGDRLLSQQDTRLPFRDLRDGSAWCVAPRGGAFPLWLFDPARRVPGVPVTAYLTGLWRLATAGPSDTVAGRLDGDDPLYARLWAPLAVSILNTEPERASARLLWTVFRRTLLRGADACRPYVARDGLSDALVDPALAFLKAGPAQVRFNTRIAALDREPGGRVHALRTPDARIPMGPADRVVLALPPPRAAELLPGLPVPVEHRAILNAHFRLERPVDLPGGAPLLGLVGGTAEWLFARGDVVSVTVSAADRMIDRPSGDLAETIWRDVARALDLSGPCPVHRIVKEKRATFAATPDSAALRPVAGCPGGNVLLAGDWTGTGLPATIEGAVQSGHLAARLAMAD